MQGSKLFYGNVLFFVLKNFMSKKVSLRMLIKCMANFNPYLVFNSIKRKLCSSCINAKG